MSQTRARKKDPAEKTASSLVQDAEKITSAVEFVENLIDSDGLLEAKQVVSDIFIPDPNDPTGLSGETERGVITRLSEQLVNMVNISREYPDIQCKFNVDLNELLFMRNYLESSYGSVANIRSEPLVVNKDVYSAFVSFEHFLLFLSGLVEFFQPRMPKTGFVNYVDNFNMYVQLITQFPTTTAIINETKEGIRNTVQKIDDIILKLRGILMSDAAIDKNTDGESTEPPSVNPELVSGLKELASLFDQLGLLVDEFNKKLDAIKDSLQAIEIMEIVEIIERYIHGHCRKDTLEGYMSDIQLFDANIRCFNEKKGTMIDLIKNKISRLHHEPLTGTENQDAISYINKTNEEIDSFTNWFNDASFSLEAVSDACKPFSNSKKLDPSRWIGKVDMGQTAVKMEEKFAIGLVFDKPRNDKMDGKNLRDSSEALLKLFKVHIDDPTRANMANEEIRHIPYGQKAIPKSVATVDRDIIMTRFMILVMECTKFCERVRKEFFTVKRPAVVTHLTTLTCQPTLEKSQLTKLMDCFEEILLIGNRYFSHTVDELNVQNSETQKVEDAFDLFNKSRIGTRNKVWGLDTYAIKSRQVFRGIMKMHDSTYAASVRSYIRNTSMILLTMVLIVIAALVYQFFIPSSVFEEMIIETDQTRTVYFDKSANVTAWRETIDNRKSSCRPFNETALECDIIERTPDIYMWGLPIIIYASFAMVITIVSFATAFLASLLYTESLGNSQRMPRVQHIKPLALLLSLNRMLTMTALVLQLASVVTGPLVFSLVLYFSPNTELYTRKQDGSMRINTLYLMISAAPCFLIAVFYFAIVYVNYAYPSFFERMRAKLKSWLTSLLKYVSK